MTNPDFKIPGIAAILLAVLFPIYWLSVFSGSYDDFEQAFRSDLTTLGWSDALFILIGALEIYIYLSLRKILADQLETTVVNLLLFIMMGMVALFHSLVLVDIYLASQYLTINTDTVDQFVSFSLLIAFTTMIIYSVVGLVFSILLLSKGLANSIFLKVFSALLIATCIMQMTLILAVVNVVLFPITLLVLAVYFFKEPQMAEVV
jgi:hypothetical protein